MKFYFLHYSFEPGITADIAGFRKLWELAYHLQEQKQSVKIFSPNLPTYKPLKPIPYSVYPVANIFILRPLSAYFFMFFSVLIQGVRDRPDIIYLRGSANIFFIILARVLGSRIITEVNASFYDFYKTVHISRLRYFIFYFTEKFSVLLSDKIITVTTGLKELLVNKYSISPDKIYVIPSATDINHFFPQQIQEAKKAIGVDPHIYVIGFAGIFYPHQGVHTLILAARQIIKVYPDARFLIVGSGIMRKNWEDLVKREGLENSFIFTGQVSYEKMPIYFNAMDICVAPFIAKRGETSPFKVLDALACERVVVASNIPSMEPLKEEFGRAIEIVPPDDAETLAGKIIALLPQEIERKKEARRGREIIIEKYSWQKNAEKLLNNL